MPVVDGDPKRVLTSADCVGPQLGVRGNYDQGLPLRYTSGKARGKLLLVPSLSS